MLPRQRHAGAPLHPVTCLCPAESRGSDARGCRDWRSHGLYAPPSGHQWVQVDSEFVLVALATGLIANLLIN